MLSTRRPIYVIYRGVDWCDCGTMDKECSALPLQAFFPSDETKTKPLLNARISRRPIASTPPLASTLTYSHRLKYPPCFGCTGLVTLAADGAPGSWAELANDVGELAQPVKFKRFLLSFLWAFHFIPNDLYQKAV